MITKTPLWKIMQTSFLFSARSSNLKLKPAAAAAALLRAAARGVLALLQHNTK
jgi:hypothetical protein